MKCSVDSYRIRLSLAYFYNLSACDLHKTATLRVQYWYSTLPFNQLAVFGHVTPDSQSRESWSSWSFADPHAKLHYILCFWNLSQFEGIKRKNPSTLITAWSFSSDPQTTWSIGCEVITWLLGEELLVLTELSLSSRDLYHCVLVEPLSDRVGNCDLFTGKIDNKSAYKYGLWNYANPGNHCTMIPFVVIKIM